MKIVIISGSGRSNSQSLKVSNWIKAALVSKSIDSEIIDLSESELPIRHEEIWGELATNEVAINIRSKLTEADGFVIVSPEWSGMSSPALKNFFLYVNNEMADKPSFIVGVSGARGGAYPVAELRMSSYKNTHISYIPEQLIVRQVDNLFNTAQPVDEKDIYLQKRAQYGLDVLVKYAEALKHVRDSKITDYETYPHGM